jgi:cation transport ATPase
LFPFECFSQDLGIWFELSCLLHSIWTLLVLFSLFLAVLGFELSVLHFPGRCTTVWVTPSVLFSVAVLVIGFPFLPRPAWTVILLFYASWCCWVGRQVSYTQLFSILIGSHKLFCLGLPGTTIFLISVSHLLEQYMPSHPAIGWYGVSLTFCPGWPQLPFSLSLPPK